MCSYLSCQKDHNIKFFSWIIKFLADDKIFDNSKILNVKRQVGFEN